MTPTSQQIAVLQHTIGVSMHRRTPYRNHFVAGHGHHDMPHLEALERAGLMERRRSPGFLAAGDIVFAATEAGHAAAIAALPEPPKRTRYREYLDADGGDSFGEFLCGGRLPMIEERGGGWHGGPREYRMYRCGWSGREVQGTWASTKKDAKASYKAALAAHRAARKEQQP